MSDPLNYLGSILYHSEPLQVLFSKNYFCGREFFAIPYSKPALVGEPVWNEKRKEKTRLLSNKPPTTLQSLLTIKLLPAFRCQWPSSSAMAASKIQSQSFERRCYCMLQGLRTCFVFLSLYDHGRLKVHERMLVIWAAQPGPNDQLFWLHSFKIKVRQIFMGLVHQKLSKKKYPRVTTNPIEGAQ